MLLQFDFREITDELIVTTAGGSRRNYRRNFLGENVVTVITEKRGVTNGSVISKWKKFGGQNYFFDQTDRFIPNGA